MFVKRVKSSNSTMMGCILSPGAGMQKVLLMALNSLTKRKSWHCTTTFSEENKLKNKCQAAPGKVLSQSRYVDLKNMQRFIGTRYTYFN